MGFISKDEAIAMLEDMEGRRDEDGYIRVYKMDVIANLRSLPSIDLVRCEECIYNTDNTDGDSSGWCYKHGIDIIDFCSKGETDFCSDGERKSE